MTRRHHSATALVATALLLALAGCGATRRPAPRASATAAALMIARAETPAGAGSGQSRPGASGAPASSPRVRIARTPSQALVSAQTENQILVIDLPTGRVARQVTVAGDPEYVATASSGPGSIAVVVSASAGTVTLLHLGSLRPVKVLHGFASPHIPAISPDGGYAYVTDDATGKVTVIGLKNDGIRSRITVGAGAHHLAFSPDGRQVWIALGQSARTIAILSTQVGTPSPPSSPVEDPGHPHVIGHVDLGFPAHDLLFTPDGQRVWITSAGTADVGVFSARSHRLLFRVPAGPPPQHLAFAGRFAYVTSGYGSRIEQVALNSGRVLRRVRAPYGSFELSASGGYVVTASLFRGTVAIYNTRLRLLHIRHLASSTEDVTIVQP